MPTLIILVGPPGCGKSTFASQCTYDHFVYVNQDKHGREGHRQLFAESIAKKKNIIVDRMNFSKQQRAPYLEAAKAAGYTSHIYVFHTPRKVCLDRCLARKDHETIKDAVAANSAINLFFGKYEKPTPDEAYFINFIEHSSDATIDKPKAIICDLDGTLADCSHRVHYVQGDGKKNWPAFFRGISRDNVNEWCADILKRFSGDHEIVYCSGRDEACREETEKWLKANGLWYGHLFMRSLGDYRPDNLVKEILLDFNILPQFDPRFVIDDRKSVTQMWRRRKLTCLQCAEGDF